MHHPIYWNWTHSVWNPREKQQYFAIKLTHDTKFLNSAATCSFNGSEKLLQRLSIIHRQCLTYLAPCQVITMNGLHYWWDNERPSIFSAGTISLQLCLVLFLYTLGKWYFQGILLVFRCQQFLHHQWYR